jgi:hypothetical protein
VNAISGRSLRKIAIWSFWGKMGSFMPRTN